MIKGFILIHLMEFFESHVNAEKIEELKKSHEPQTSLLREALVYSNEYPIELIHDYGQLIRFCKLESEEYYRDCGRYLGDNIFDHFFYIYHQKGLYPFLESLRNLFVYIFGQWTFNFTVHDNGGNGTILFECEPTSQLPDLFVKILQFAFYEMLIQAGAKVSENISFTQNNGIYIFEFRMTD